MMESAGILPALGASRIPLREGKTSRGQLVKDGWLCAEKRRKRARWFVAAKCQNVYENTDVKREVENRECRAKNQIFENKGVIHYQHRLVRKTKRCA